MEKTQEEFDITKKCWNNMDKLEKDRSQNIKFIYQYFHDLLKVIDEFNKSYKNLYLEDNLNGFNESGLNDITRMFHNVIINFITTIRRMVMNVKDKFKDIAKILKESEQKYKEYSPIFEKYKIRKKKLDGIRTSFREKMEKLENNIKAQYEKDSNFEESKNKQDKKLQNEIIANYKEFKKEMSESNKSKNEIDEGKKKMFSYYEKVIKAEPNLFTELISNLLYITKELTNNYNESYNKLAKLRAKFKENEYIMKTIES